MIQMGKVIGGAPTLLLIISTAVVGVVLLRQQGMSTFLRAQKRLAQQELPKEELLEGLLLPLGGLLLLLPGFITDFAGFACLLPWTRRALVRRVLPRFRSRAVHVQRPPVPGQTLEGEYEREDKR